MDHSGMDHGDSGHGGMGTGDKCSMNMLFTWDTTDLCVVFRQWHVRGPLSLFTTLLAIVVICAGYEALREATRRYEALVVRRQEEVPRQRQAGIGKRAHVVKALLYAVQNFYAFMIMLLFMTYNGWVMLAVAVGAFAGYLAFGSTTSVTKETACH